MRDYSKGKIYTIRNIINENHIYVGSTVEEYLSKRFQKHKTQKHCSLYKFINESSNNTVWNDWYIELYEEYPCANRLQHCKRENEIIREIATINKNGFATYESTLQKRKEWNEKNKEILKEKNIAYRKANRETLLQKKREYNEQNRELKNSWGKELVTCDCGSTCLR